MSGRKNRKGPTAPHNKAPATRESLQEVIARNRARQSSSATQPRAGLILNTAKDPYETADSFMNRERGKTGLGYDINVTDHSCSWDVRHPETFQRFIKPFNRIMEMELDKRCLVINNPLARIDLVDSIQQVHTNEHIQTLLHISSQTEENIRETSCAQYDSIYMNQSTFEAANRAVTIVLNLCDALMERKIQNGLALIRPPGHHAGSQEFNGYCFLNNVAIAAQHLIARRFAKKVLIIDIDVHHGQGTQRTFYNRKDVLYFSIHRYEHGSFWPYLCESNFTATGDGEGKGYNINVPLNATCLKDDDYLAIVLFLLLPVAYEFNPDVVLVSAGYDAAVGCPEGRMLVTPAFYSHLITLLGGIAEGRLLVILEGGYFIPSLSEGVVMTLKALLDDPCPKLDPVRGVDRAVVDVINNVRAVHSSYWNCFKNTIEFAKEPTANDHVVKTYFQGRSNQPPYPTRYCYPVLNKDDNAHFHNVIDGLKLEYHRERPTKVGYVYNARGLSHAPTKASLNHIVKELPSRIISLMELFRKWKLTERTVEIPLNSEEERHEIERYNHHDKEYLESINETFVEKNDLFCNESTKLSCEMSIEGLLKLSDEILFRNTILRGAAVIRPPGHHAEAKHGMGYCFMNNVVILANYLTERYAVNRIVIVDFDVHHGNGTQNALYTNPNVLYISVHRYDEAAFFPQHVSANYTYSGFAAGEGYNMNIPFSGQGQYKMTDSEYIAVFLNIILPTIYSFGPDFVIVSAGYDAGVNDPLGHYNLSPQVFGHFMQLLKPFAGGKLIMALEGGYNPTTLAYSFNMSVKALLGDPLPRLAHMFDNFSPVAQKTIRDVVGHFVKYYPIFNCLNKIAPTALVYNRVKETDWKTYSKMTAQQIPVGSVDTFSFADTFSRY